MRKLPFGSLLCFVPFLGVLAIPGYCQEESCVTEAAPLGLVPVANTEENVDIFSPPPNYVAVDYIPINYTVNYKWNVLDYQNFIGFPSIFGIEEYWTGFSFFWRRDGAENELTLQEAIAFGNFQAR